MLAERGVEVDHSSVYRWVQKFTPYLEAALRKGKKRPVGKSWRMDATYIKIKGQWKDLYRAVDRDGQTVDFLLTAHHDKKAALRFLKKAMRQHGLPDKITIDKSSANTAAIEALKESTDHVIEIRQNKYLNNLIEQDHRTVKRIVRPMLGLQSFRSARVTLQGIERVHRIKKGQMSIVPGRGYPLPSNSIPWSPDSIQRSSESYQPQNNATQPVVVSFIPFVQKCLRFGRTAETTQHCLKFFHR